MIKMINANELRIGNWILIKNKPTKIESIDMQGINSSTSGGYYAGDVEIEYEAYFEGETMWRNYPAPHPIPLTPEIIENCGFEYHDGQITFYKNGKVILYWDGEELSANFGHIKQLDVYIQYLHQLQNLYFALTGTELVYNK